MKNNSRDKTCSFSIKLIFFFVLAKNDWKPTKPESRKCNGESDWCCSMFEKKEENKLDFYYISSITQHCSLLSVNSKDIFLTSEKTEQNNEFLTFG